MSRLSLSFTPSTGRLALRLSQRLFGFTVSKTVPLVEGAKRTERTKATQAPQTAQEAP